jgi:hypothetical protein
MSIAMRKGGVAGGVQRAVGHIQGAASVRGWSEVKGVCGVCKGDYTGNTTAIHKWEDVLGADTQCEDLVDGGDGGGGVGGGSRAQWWR